jgi:hypothetical protein
MAKRRISWALACLSNLAIVAGGLWGSLALYYAVRGSSWVPALLALVFALAMFACLFVSRRPMGLAIASCLFAAVVVWWMTLVPSNARNWEPEYAIAPSVDRDGELVTIHGIRNGDYDAGGKFEPNTHSATFAVGELNEVDLVSSHWGSDAIAHVFISFGFTDGRHIAISVETRREVGEEYSILGGFFRRYEIIYVAADERDLIGVRSDVRRESVYLYPLVATNEEIRRLFLSYVDRIASLSTNPEFYNTVTNNCTTNVLQRANAVSSKRIPSNWTVLLSGYSDEYVYDLGRMSHRLPFADLKQESLIRRPPGARPGKDFSSDIRRQSRAGVP